MSKAHHFLQIVAKQQYGPFFYCVSNNKNFIPKYLDYALTDFRLNVTNIEAAIGGRSSRE